MKAWAQKQTGFTIVELLIVIVVIAILAAITIVSYNGIQNRAYDTTVQNDLKSLGSKTLAYIATENRSLPLSDDAEMTKLGLSVTASAYGAHYLAGGLEYNLLFCWNSTLTPDNVGFVAASKSGKVFVFKNGSVKEGVGPLVTYTTTCTNNGLPANSSWFYNGGNWRWVRA